MTPFLVKIARWLGIVAVFDTESGWRIGGAFIGALNGVATGLECKLRVPGNRVSCFVEEMARDCQKVSTNVDSLESATLAAKQRLVG
jgi:hypothetical protein